MRKIIVTTILSLLALCAGCGSHPKIRKLSPASIIVAFGDSLTSGTGASHDESYPAVLATMIGCRVVNAGVSGETTTSGLGRLPSVLENERPDLLILCHGGNDLLNGQDPSVTIANLNAMIAMAKNAGADIILLGVPKPALLLSSAPYYQEIATKHELPIDAGTLSSILSTPALKSDLTHPNAPGYRRLAAAIQTLIRKSQG